MLVCATAGSTAGNIAHAWTHPSTVTAGGAILAAAIPPLALLSLTHLAGMWSRISGRGVVYWCFLLAVACIAAAAFRLSFDALRSLAVQYGYGHADAALFPLILDGLIAVCTLGLVMLSRIEAPHRDAADAHRDAPAVDRDAGSTSTDAASAAGEAGAGRTGDAVQRDAVLHHGDAPKTQLCTTAVRNGAVATHRSAGAAAVHLGGAAPDAPDAHRELARHLVDSGRTTVQRELVQVVLARTAAGESSRAVAAKTGLSPSSVQRIVKAARDETAVRT